MKQKFLAAKVALAVTLMAGSITTMIWPWLSRCSWLVAHASRFSHAVRPIA